MTAAKAGAVPKTPAPGRPAMTLDLAKLFVLVAQQGSIAAAARTLNVDPSLATRKLAQLERALEARVFERTTRSMTLTEAGVIALRWATEAVDSFEKATDELARLQERPAGPIRIAATQYASTVYLPPLLAEFNLQYPDVHFVVSTTDSPVNLIEEHHDLAIHSGRVPNTLMVGQKLREFQRVLCASPAYLKAHGMPLALSDLLEHNCLVHSANEPRNWHFQLGRELLSQPVRVHLETDNYSVLIELARQSMGIIRISLNLVESDLNSGRLVRLLPEYKCVYSNGDLPGLWLLYPNRKVQYRTRLLIDFLKRHLKAPVRTKSPVNPGRR